MAGVTSHSTGVVGGVHLGEELGFGAIGLVTARAEDCGIELGGLDRGGVVGVLGLRAMASFAGDMRMAAGFFLVHHIDVAGLAGFVTCVRDGTGRDFFERRPAKVAVLPEGLRNDRRTKQQERHYSDQHYRGEPKKMFRVPEQGRITSWDMSAPIALCA